MVFFNIILTNFRAHRIFSHASGVYFKRRHFGSGVYFRCNFVAFFDYWAELLHGTDEGELQNYTNKKSNTVKVTRFRKAILLVVGRFFS